MLNKRPGLRAILDFVNTIDLCRVSERRLIPADVNDPDPGSDQIKIPDDPVELLVGEKLDHPAGFEPERIAGISADISYRVSRDLADQLVADLPENKKLLTNCRPIEVLKRPFSHR